MRVIAGRFKGRRLATPGWPGLRPTSDKLRETLFNVLGPRVAGARVLDACAGTGAVGIEALSRGAVHVTFVDSDRRAAALIARNLGLCRVEAGYAIIRADVRVAASRMPHGDRFDLILLDPPYDSNAVPELVAELGRRLAPGGLLVLEHATRQAVPDAAGALRRVREVKSGDSALALYEESASLP